MPAARTPGVAPGIVGIRRLRQHHLEREHLFGRKAGIHIREAREAPDQQRGADQQHQ
jgi:ribosome modulation factor